LFVEASRTSKSFFSFYWWPQITNPIIFLIVIGFYVFFQSMMSSGIISSVITTIEQRYGLRSVESGFVVSSFDIGSILVVIFISYLGGKSHRPRVVAIGALLTSFGALFFCLPQLISDTSLEDVISFKNVSSSDDHQLCGRKKIDEESCLKSAKGPDSTALGLFVIANMLIGIGSTPIHTLATTFLHDNVKRESASIYISIFYVLAAIGPAIGYIIGGIFLTIPVDLSNIQANSTQFIGAWWLGFLLSFSVIAINAIFIFMFPAKLRDVEVEVVTPLPTPLSPVSDVSMATSNQEEESYNDGMIGFGKDLKELPKAFRNLFYNPIYICVTLSATLEFSVISANLTFVPKYLISQFAVDTTSASILTGAVLIPAAGIGVMTGGYLIKFFKLNLTGCSLTALCSSSISTFLFLTVFFLSCDPTHVLDDSDDSLKVVSRLQLECNLNCSCPSSLVYDPVCLDQKTYYSPCHAGCTRSFFDTSNMTTFSHCTCGNVTSLASPGECERSCRPIVAQFMICLFFITMTMVSSHTPLLMITYRCVSDRLRPFAAGLQFLFFRALAYIPAPIYFGVIIDTTCILWSQVSCDQVEGSGSCLVCHSSLFSCSTLNFFRFTTTTTSASSSLESRSRLNFSRFSSTLDLGSYVVRSIPIISTQQSSEDVER